MVHDREAAELIYAETADLADNGYGLCVDYAKSRIGYAEMANKCAQVAPMAMESVE